MCRSTCRVLGSFVFLPTPIVKILQQRDPKPNQKRSITKFCQGPDIRLLHTTSYEVTLHI